MNFDKKLIRNHAEGFSIDIFKSRIKSFVDKKHEEFRRTKHWEV